MRRASPVHARRSRLAGRVFRSLGVGGFTLAEILAALLFMAIVIPVAMQGVSVASRAGILGQRKAAAMRIAERVLDETIATGGDVTAAANGTITDGEFSYPWTLKSDQWPEGSMTQLTVTVTFELQGNQFDIRASTIVDPNATTNSAPGSTATTTL